jgi:BirA family biotin operon repressor/biotin-[acetyl-CoA-carboxylase] ligase
VNTLFLGKNFLSLASVGSTNDVALALLDSKPADGTVVQATDQTAGRGQRGNQWQVEPGMNLTFSLILYPTWLVGQQVFTLNKLIACALHETVAKFLPDSDVKIKWPNDLLVNRKKVAGMLIETQIEGDRLRVAVIGIGLNVNQLEFGQELQGRATSLAVEAGKHFSIENVLDCLLEKIEARYLKLRSGNSSQVEHDYLKHLFGYQEDILLEVNGEQKLRHIVGVDRDGRLAVQEEGKLYFYGLKEIQFCLA